METIDLEQLESALQELAISINEARGLLYSGKLIQGDRKLQGSAAKCGTILTYICDLKNTDKDKNPDVMACETPETSKE